MIHFFRRPEGATIYYDVIEGLYLKRDKTPITQMDRACLSAYGSTIKYMTANRVDTLCRMGATSIGMASGSHVLVTHIVMKGGGMLTPSDSIELCESLSMKYALPSKSMSIEQPRKSYIEKLLKRDCPNGIAVMDTEIGGNPRSVFVCASKNENERVQNDSFAIIAKDLISFMSTNPMLPDNRRRGKESSQIAIANSIFLAYTSQRNIPDAFPNTPIPKWQNLGKTAIGNDDVYALASTTTTHKAIYTLICAILSGKKLSPEASFLYTDYDADLCSAIHRRFSKIVENL